MNTTDMDDIERAAQRMLDEAGPERLKRFLASYDEDERTPAIERLPAQPPPTRLAMKAEQMTDNDDPTPPDTMALLREAVRNLGANQDKAVAKLLNDKCEEYFASDAFKKDFAAQTDTSSIKCVTDALRRLRNALASRTLDFDHGVDLTALRAVLMRDTHVTFVIPLPKRFRKPLELRTTAPLTGEKRHALYFLNECLLELAAFAHHAKSDSERGFKSAYLTAMSAFGGPRADQEAVARPLGKAAADEIVRLFANGYRALFADVCTVTRCREIWGEAE